MDAENPEEDVVEHVTELQPAEESKLAVIDRDGDVILVIGSPPVLKLQVLSFCLRKTSRVFDAMFSGHFAEGLDLDPASPKEVSLPEDDPHAMMALCNLAHQLHEAVPTKFEIRDILTIAEASHKYDCNSLCRFTSYSWLQRAPDDGHAHQLKDTFLLAVAAYLFKEPTSFRKYMRALIYEHVWTIGRLDTVLNYLDIILVHALVYLQRQHDIVMGIVYKFLDKLKSQPCNNPNPCQHWSKVGPFVLEELERSGNARPPYKGLSERSIQEVCEILNLNCSQWPSTSRKCQAYHPFDSESTVKDFLVRIKGYCCGLCLECVRAGENFAHGGCGHTS